jgi:carbon-monoxide dehydrogenase medium subunit
VSHLVDLGGIPGLSFLRLQDGTIHIGALSTHAMLAESALLAEHQPLLARAAAAIGDPQVRNRGTIGGSLAHADPAADLVPVLLALDAGIVVRGPRGEHTCSARDFFVSMFTTRLGPGELIVEVRVPTAPPSSRATFVKVPHKASHLAMVSLAVQLTSSPDGSCERLCLAIGGVATVPYRAHATEIRLQGRALTPEEIDAAAHLATEGVQPLSDPLVPGEYRLDVARALAARVIRSLPSHSG